MQKGYTWEGILDAYIAKKKSGISERPTRPKHYAEEDQENAKESREVEYVHNAFRRPSLRGGP
jgi:hypothetical protein